MYAIDLMTVIYTVSLALIGGLGTRAVTKNLSIRAELEGIIRGLGHEETDSYGKHAAPPK